MSYLYRYEAKGLQSFILQTNRLREMKGGSSLIENLGNGLLDVVCDAMSNGCKPEILNRAAGGANLAFKTEEGVKEFAKVWPMIVEQFAPRLQVIQGYVKLVKGKERTSWDELQEKLREGRNRFNTSLPEAGPAVFRAPRTGLPAYKLNQHLPGDKKERQDKGLFRRSESGGSEDYSIGKKIDPSIKWATEIVEHIGEHPIAVVHIDGNDLGFRIKKLMEKEDILESLESFSNALSALTLKAAQTAAKGEWERLNAKILTLKADSDLTLKAAQTAAKGEWERLNAKILKLDVFPGRPIVLGGDDITFMMRADLALPFVKACLAAFEKESKSKSEVLLGTVTACAGIAFISRTFPFNLGHHLAENLCSFAKKKLRGKGDEDRTASGIAFHRVTTSMISDYSEILKTELASETESAYLTAGPYTIESVDGFTKVNDLENLSRLLSELPSTPVRETISLLKHDRKKALERWDRLGEVINEPFNKNSKQKDAWEEVKAFEQPDKTLSATGVLEREKDVKHTLLFDAWVLTGFLGKEEK